MSEPRAVQGDYADFKLIKTRQVCQLVIEVPLEKAAEVTRLLGFPKPGTGTRCAVALLNDGAKDLPAGTTPVSSETGPGGKLDTGPVGKPKQHWEDMLPSAQAATLCGDPTFWAYLAYISGAPVTDKVEADASLKARLGIGSKAVLNRHGETADAFDQLIGDYRAWAYRR